MCVCIYQLRQFTLKLDQVSACLHNCGGGGTMTASAPSFLVGGGYILTVLIAASGAVSV